MGAGQGTEMETKGVSFKNFNKIHTYMHSHVLTSPVATSQKIKHFRSNRLVILISLVALTTLILELKP